jgi:hypothetical protein
MHMKICGLAFALTLIQIQSKGIQMQNSKTFICASCAVLLATTAALADNPLPKDNENIVKYGKVEGWTTYANNTRRNCYIARVDGPNAVQMGVTSNREVGYVGVFTKNDIGIKNKSKSEIFISIDGNVYAGIATGMKGHIQGGYSGGYFLADNPELKRDLAKKYKMIVFPETKGTFVVDLTGTYKAMEMGRKCIKEQAAK